MSLNNLFLIKFWKFLALYLDCGCMTFDFTTHMTLAKSHLHPLVNKKMECKDHQIYPKCWNRSIKRNSNLRSQFHQSWELDLLIKISSYSYTDIYGPNQTFLRILWWRFLVLCSERLLASSTTLNISTLSLC